MAEKNFRRLRRLNKNYILLGKAFRFEITWSKAFDLKGGIAKFSVAPMSCTKCLVLMSFSC